MKIVRLTTLPTKINKLKRISVNYSVNLTLYIAVCLFFLNNSYENYRRMEWDD